MKQAIGLISILTLLLLLPSCAATVVKQGVTASDEKDNILLINSNQAIPRYKIAETAFVNTLPGSSIHIINLEDDRRPIDTLLDSLKQQPYDAIYAIGAKALGSVDYIEPPIPVVYNSVLSWRQFQSRTHYFGVASEIGPQAQLTWFKYFFPEITKVGVLYSETNQALIDDARQFAQALSIQLVTEKLYSKSDRQQKAATLLNQVDAMWILPDPLLLDSESNIRQLFKLSHAMNKPVFTYNAFFMELGATLSINADLATSGRQAALIMRSLLTNRKPETPIQFPAGSNISLSLKKVQQYNLMLNEEALNSVSELLED
jgi:putative ABC transport system substrate-binding protein